MKKKKKDLEEKISTSISLESNTRTARKPTKTLLYIELKILTN